MRIIPVLIVATSLGTVTAFAATRETPPADAPLGDGGADGMAAATSVSVSVSASSVTTVTSTGATTATTTTSSASGRGR